MVMAARFTAAAATTLVSALPRRLPPPWQGHLSGTVAPLPPPAPSTDPPLALLLLAAAADIVAPHGAPAAAPAPAAPGEAPEVEDGRGTCPGGKRAEAAVVLIRMAMVIANLALFRR